MQTLDKDTKFAHLGKPGSSFSKGFQRRLDIITKLVDFKDKKILDLGCGLGVWDEQFLKFTNAENIYGTDIDSESISNLKSQVSSLKKENFTVSEGEGLPFAANTFDIVFSNEVMEHVKDDVQVMKEVLRVLKPGGKYVFFTPNRGWPFETHGMFFRGKYIWGNIPFLPWMPKKIFNKFAPHVRNYSNGEIKSVVKKAINNQQSAVSKPHPASGHPLLKEREFQSPVSSFESQIIYHKHVFPAFDKLERKFGILGKLLQKTFHFLEKTPFHFFGISHLVIVQKT